MRIAEAAGFVSLREEGLRGRTPKDTRSALQLAEDVFAEAEEREEPFLYHTPKSWARKWLPSKTFHLVRMPLNAAAMPCEPKIGNLVLKKIHAMESKPIIVDYNRNQVGKSLHGFVPQVIVIDGKHRFKAAMLRGETHILAWVGDVAAEGMKGCDAKNVRAFGSGGGPSPESTTPATGARLNAKGSAQSAKLAQRIGTTYSGGKLKLDEMNVKKIWSSFQQAVAAGWKKDGIEATSPPGWEDTVKRMKKHKDITNPWALAWWMDEQGYSPGGEKGKDK